MSKTRRIAASVAVALAATIAIGTAGKAEAAPVKFANCTAMHKHYKHGVAKSKVAAAKQVRQGNGKPAVKPMVYKANINSDRDKDGTACEA
jgi:hypothetical protein